MALKKITLTKEHKELAEVVAQGLKSKYCGEANAVSNSQICKSLKSNGISMTPETFRKIIFYLRKAGNPICSNSKGYYWAANKREIEECAEALKERINAQIETYKSLIKTIENVP